MPKTPVVALSLALLAFLPCCQSSGPVDNNPTPTPAPTPCLPGAFASAVPDSAVLPVVNGSANRNTDVNRTLGAPDGQATSLGVKDCFVVLDLGAGGITDCSGEDITVIELGNVSYKVSVAAESNSQVWTVLGEATGVASFDLRTAGIACTRFVRIDQTGNDTVANIQAGSPGSDIDSVRAIAACR